MKKILITGSNGQLGSELRKLSVNFPYLSFHFADIEELDITNTNSINLYFENNSYNYIINCAAYTAVDKAESEPDKALLINSEAVKHLSEIALRYKIKLIHISTDYVFDGTSCKPYTEEVQVCPVSQYGITKLEGEKQIEKSGCDAIIIRTSWLYSSFGNNFVKTILKYSKEKPELKVVFDQIGTPTYAEDLASAILQIINSNKFETGIYHFSNEGVCSWYDFALEIVNAKNINCKITPILTSEYPTPAKRPHFSVLNKNKIKNTYNLTIPHWKESLYNCLLEINLISNI